MTEESVLSYIWQCAFLPCLGLFDSVSVHAKNLGTNDIIWEIYFLDLWQKYSTRWLYLVYLESLAEKKTYKMEKFNIIQSALLALFANVALIAFCLLAFTAPFLSKPPPLALFACCKFPTLIYFPDFPDSLLYFPAPISLLPVLVAYFWVLAVDRQRLKDWIESQTSLRASKWPQHALALKNDKCQVWDWSEVAQFFIEVARQIIALTRWFEQINIFNITLSSGWKRIAYRL